MNYQEALDFLYSHCDTYEFEEDIDEMLNTRATAKKTLQKLIDKQDKYKLPKLIDCKCGGKRREHWCIRNNGCEEVELRCIKCGARVKGNSERNARLKWNEVMSNE